MNTPITSRSKFFSAWADVFRISWPLIVANSFWNLQLTIDRIYLGHYSTEALGAAMGVTGVFWTPMALIQQTAAYVTTFVAQYSGAQKPRDIGPAVWQSIYVSVIGGILFLLLIPLSGWMFRLMGHSPAMQQLESDFFSALCYSALPVALVAAAGGFLTGLGRSQAIMWINCVGLVANVILDYIMIFGKFGFPAMGVAGAGYATAIASWCSAIYAGYLIFNRNNERDFAIYSGWRYSKELMVKFIRYGLPSGMQWALEGMAFTVFLLFVGRMPNGDAALSASGIAVTLMMLAILPAVGVGQGVSVLVGQYVGERNPSLAEKYVYAGVQMALLYIVTIGITFVVIPDFYLSWFRNDTNPAMWAAVSTIVPYILMYMAVFTMFDSLNFVVSFALKGAGDTRFVSIIALIMPWPLMVLPTYLVQNQPNAVYLAWGAASFYIITLALVFLVRFRRGKWKTMSVING